ncbi:PREDICTED: aldose 1-epimerase-like [Ceratosolen solmsi marchali]|uniref:Galactose mutarotase n=1 Tax=Ceratosolen solmsi marchali TaxID=326594 RepID=A0AAJ7E2Q4_9HYME|nr:PREDICTED: aldose 1-epimerase-like [Ceratosolen solmsi marchali]
MTKPNCDCRKISIIEGEFGEILSDDNNQNDDRVESTGSSSYDECECSTNEKFFEPIKIKSYTMTNDNGMEVVLISWGATIVSIKCPDKYGEVADIVLGFDDLQTYLDPTLNNYIGCVLGRSANHIMNGTFKIQNLEYFLTKNDGNKHHLHGGINGFGRRVWEPYIEDGSHVIMSLLSDDGEEGYPGSVFTTIKFRLTNNNSLEINMRASTSKPTVVNLSHGSLFNLAGHGTGKTELMEHEISLNCDRWTYTDCENPIPTGKIRDVGGTIMDLRMSRKMKDVIEKVPLNKGYNHNFCVVRSVQPQVSLISRISHAKSGRFLEVYSDQPGVQFYTGGQLPPYSLNEGADSDDCNKSCHDSSSGGDCECSCDCETEIMGSQSSTVEYLPGKCGTKYTQFGAFSVQPQNYPNAINVKNFPSSVLRPGQFYYHDLIYKFGVHLNNPR